jgi:hypothetical protein
LKYDVLEKIKRHYYRNYYRHYDLGRNCPGRKGRVSYALLLVNHVGQRAAPAERCSVTKTKERAIREQP